VVLGGYGYFGASIAKALAGAGDFDVVVAGRDEARAAAMARSLGAGHARLDATDARLADRLAETGARLVINTAGPFQRRDHGVARACIAAGAHYVDLADSREFVRSVTALDQQARAADVLVVSGASSVPALAAAVVDRYLADFGALHEIDHGISSSSRVPGAATLAAVLGYCGRPFTRLRDGAWATTHGGQAMRRHRFQRPPMTRWIGDCDVPDLALFPERYPTVRSVRFGAGVESRFVQWSFWLLSWMVRGGLIRDAQALQPLLEKGARAFTPLGSGRSAMFVTLRGTDRAGAALERRWELRASGEEGAMIPCMASVAVARKLARGTVAARGAMPCVGLVTLAEYLEELESWEVEAHEDA
jgi:saccharopine dehydrogenase-like NADP-dependent oxidoreductase